MTEYLPRPIEYYFDLSGRGSAEGDSNCSVHAGVLYDTLRHYQRLRQAAARKVRPLKEILFRARQIERILGIDSIVLQRPSSQRCSERLAAPCLAYGSCNLCLAATRHLASRR